MEPEVRNISSIVPWTQRVKVVDIYMVTQQHLEPLYCVALYIPSSLSGSTELRNYGTGTAEHMFRSSGSVVPWTSRVNIVYVG